MSQGPRIPRKRAADAATLLLATWGMSPGECMVAGSVRRGLAEVGDLDLVAPMPPESDYLDRLYAAIDATVDHKGSLFPPERKPFTTVLSGLKPRFKSVCLEVTLTGLITGREKDLLALPVQIHRYTPDNRGWVELMKTGPTEFNIWFLAKWKERFQIRPKVSTGNPEGHALIDNHLVDPWGKLIPVGAEGECFDKLGIPFVHPADRATHPGVDRASANREREQVLR